MNRATFRVRGLTCFLGLLACTGCSSRSDPALVPVEGKATVGGQPLTVGDVTFFPAEAGGVPLNIVGKIGADGTYKMTTNGKTGAPKGKYKVTVYTMIASSSPVAPDISKAPPPPKRKVNAKYESPDATDLTIEVPSASYDLNLSPP